MSTASRPLSTLPSAPWPSVTLPITVTFSGTVFPSMSTRLSTSNSVVTTSGPIIMSSSPTSATTTTTGGQNPSTGTTSTITTTFGTRSTIPTSSSLSTRLSSSLSSLQSFPFTRTLSSTTQSPTVTSTSLIGTLAPSDDSGTAGGANSPTVAAAEEISHLKETRNIVIAVLSALALVAVLVAARAVYLRRRGHGYQDPPPTPLPQHKSPSGPLLTSDTPMGGHTHGAPWPFLAVPAWHPPQLNRLAPPPPPSRLPQPQPYTNVHLNHPHRASILPQTLDAWIAGAGSSSIDLRSQLQPTPSPHVRNDYKLGYI